VLRRGQRAQRGLASSSLQRSGSTTARAGNHRFRLLSALRAHTKAPHKMCFHRETLRALNRPKAARTDYEASTAGLGAPSAARGPPSSAPRRRRPAAPRGLHRGSWAGRASLTAWPCACSAVCQEPRPSLRPPPHLAGPPGAAARPPGPRRAPATWHSKIKLGARNI
jgi:hypothetical protein